MSFSGAFPAYGGLFALSFFAATILPGSSEAALIALVLMDRFSLVGLFLTATIGNTAGSIANWLMGRWVSRFAGRSWFPASPHRLDQARGWFEKYGVWSLLFAWVPLVGDPLTIVAGMLRVRFWVFLILVGFGKASRYAALLLGLDVVQFL